jgi:hypothetical protein
MKGGNAMLRTCCRKLTVATAGVAALVWLGAVLAVAQTPQKTPVFARIAVSEKDAVYIWIQVQGTELRVATTVPGLKTAEPVKALPGVTNGLQFGSFALPISADQLPAGVTAVNAKLGLVQVRISTNGQIETKPAICGQLTVCRPDAQKVAWQYVARIGVLADADANKAQYINLPDLDNVKATIQAKPANGKLGVGLQLMAGNAALTDVLKDGHPVQAKMVVTDASGAVKLSKDGPLSAFGFS